MTLALVLVARAGGCAAPAGSTGASVALEPQPPPPPAKREPFTEHVAGTALSFDMVPLEGGRIELDDKAIEVAPFWIARHETIWELYDVFVLGTDQDPRGVPDPALADGVTRPSRPYVPPDRGYGHRGYAAISVAFKGAEQYCRWLSVNSGRAYRLPTEAEWRLACGRAGITPETVDEHAWHDGNAEWSPHPVGCKKPDALGLHDLYGNVREWCRAADGSPVAMGGSFREAREQVGCAARAIPSPDWQMTDPQVPKSPWWLSDADFMGFRVVCDGPGPEPAPDASPEEKTDEQP